MSEANQAGTMDSRQTASDASDSGPAKRQRSSIAFPYLSLDDALATAKAVHEKVGAGPCSADQLAAWIGQSPNSSAFRGRMAAARMFGFLDTEDWEALRLTDLGRMLNDSKREREARAKGFLTVPLYRALYDRFKGGTVPPPAALEREMIVLGVAATLSERARPVFERSAEQAGFYESGRDRLVMPAFTATDPPTATHTEEPPKKEGGGGGGGDGGGDDGPRIPNHPLVRGLFESLPGDGHAWTAEELAQWLEMAAVNLRFVYKVKASKAPGAVSAQPSGSTS